MIHCILMSNGSRKSDIALPEWEPLATCDDEIRAADVFRRAVARCKAVAIAWFVVREDGFAALCGYLDYSQNRQFSHQASLNVVCTDAEKEIADMIRVHRGMGGKCQGEWRYLAKG